MSQPDGNLQTSENTQKRELHRVQEFVFDFFIFVVLDVIWSIEPIFKFKTQMIPENKLETHIL